MTTDRMPSSTKCACILCGESNAITIKTIIKPDVLIKQWDDVWGININSICNNVDAIVLYVCGSCGLQYFDPRLAGSADIYAQLEAYEWYYSRNKWTYDVAMHDINKTQNILEIGCGKGYFMEQLCRAGITNVCGIEMNPSAVQDATRKGLNVILRSVEQMAFDHKETYDVVCAFEVLEHVPDPKSFLNHAIQILRPGGSLLISVPNASGFLQYAMNNVLDYPPHHLSRWNHKVFEYYARKLGVFVSKRKYEPLSKIHFDWYVNVQLDRLPWMRYMRATIINVVRNMIAPSLLATGCYRLLRGHSIYLKMVKI